MAITAYASTTEVDQIWSEFGADVRLDDDFDGTRESGYITAFLEKASADVNRCLLPRYSVAICQASAWVKWCTAVLACCDIARRRGNPVPKSLEDEAQRYRDILERILKGEEQLITDDGIAPPAFDGSLSVSNLTVDGRYKRAKVRRVPSTSIGPVNSSGRKQWIQNEVTPFG